MAHAKTDSFRSRFARIGGSMTITGSFAKFSALDRTFCYEFERGILTERLQDGSSKVVTFADVHKFLDDLEVSNSNIQ